MTDRSRRPYRQANQPPFQIEQLIVSLKQEQPSWRAPKIREKLARMYPDLYTPAISTVHAVLDRQGLADKRYCYPLTITDQESRYLPACKALGSTKEMLAFPVFERIFREFGLPLAIWTDNGVPFVSPNALYGLSTLSAWGLRLGIAIERIWPGCPQQNGRHERMHLTLKNETTKPAGANMLQQHERFNRFIDYFQGRQAAPGDRHGYARRALFNEPHTLSRPG